MRTSGGLTFLFGDQLGSTSVTYRLNDGQIIWQLYRPWGEVRYSSGSLPTQYQYTGQYTYATDFGLYFYNARWYDSQLGRFNQADTLVPNLGDPQAWDRYAAMNNNPVVFVDPTGHMADRGGGASSIGEDWWKNRQDKTPKPPKTQYSDWNSDKYSGCFKCHLAVANGSIAVTNDQLAASYQNMQEWQAIGYSPMVATTLALGGVEAFGTSVSSVTLVSSPTISKAGVDQVLKIINDPKAQTEVMVYVNEAGKRINYFARLDILTDNAIHEVKNVANLSLSQGIMDQAYQYKLIADSAGLELHYWLMNDAPAKVVDWLQNLGAFVHTP